MLGKPSEHQSMIDLATLALVALCKALKYFNNRWKKLQTATRIRHTNSTNSRIRCVVKL